VSDRSSTSLEGIALFRNLEPEDRARLEALLHETTFPAGTNVLRYEQPGEVVYIVVAGTVKIHVIHPDGREVILAVLGKGEVVGEMSVVDSLGRSATVSAMEDCVLAWIDRASFWRCLRSMPAMTYNLVEILSRRLRLANTQMQSLAALDVDGRVARQVLAFAREYGERAGDGSVHIPLRLTQADLASLVGASRVRVNQVLVTYKRLGYLSVDRRHRITVHDEIALEQRCRYEPRV
jgi:CRP/FNR family cyclic AMP-dependent transcriptional regulator